MTELSEDWELSTSLELKVSTVKEIKSTPPLSYMIDKWLVASWLYVLSGLPGVCKTLLVMLLCKALTSGNSFLDTYEVNQTGPVLIVDQENPSSLLKDRIEKMGIDEDLLIYYVLHQGIRLDSGLFDSLLRVIEKYKPIFVVLDSLIRFHSGDENSARDMSLVMSKLRQIADMGPAVMTIHHAVKNSGRGRNKASLSRGSGDIAGAIDVEYGMTKKDKTIEIQSFKTRVEPLGPITLELVSTDSYLDLRIPGTTSSQTSLNAKDALKNFIDENSKPPNKTQFMKIVKKSSIFNDMSDNEARNIIEEGIGKFWKEISGGKNNEKLYEVLRLLKS